MFSPNWQINLMELAFPRKAMFSFGWFWFFGSVKDWTYGLATARQCFTAEYFTCKNRSFVEAEKFVKFLCEHGGNKTDKTTSKKSEAEVRQRYHHQDRTGQKSPQTDRQTKWILSKGRRMISGESLQQMFLDNWSSVCKILTSQLHHTESKC